MVFTSFVNRGRGDVVRPSPDKDLILSVVVDCLLLVKSLKSTVMTLVQLPCLLDRDPHKLRLFKNVPEGANSSLQKRGKCNVGLNPLCLDELTSLDDFFVSLGGERTVIPSSELVFKIPSGFSVSHKDQCVLISSLYENIAKIGCFGRVGGVSLPNKDHVPFTKIMYLSPLPAPNKISIILETKNPQTLVTFDINVHLGGLPASEQSTGGYQTGRGNGKHRCNKRL